VSSLASAGVARFVNPTGPAMWSGPRPPRWRLIVIAVNAVAY
jgi:hypothetical protein